MQKQLAQSKAELLNLIASIAERPDGISCEENMQRLTGQLLDPGRLEESVDTCPKVTSRSKTISAQREAKRSSCLLADDTSVLSHDACAFCAPVFYPPLR